jgi:hypothetical protein
MFKSIRWVADRNIGDDCIVHAGNLHRWQHNLASASNGTSDV